MDKEEILLGYMYAWKNIYEIRNRISEHKQKDSSTENPEEKQEYLQELEAAHEQAKKEAQETKERIIQWIKTLPEKRTWNIFKLYYINGIDKKTLASFYEITVSRINYIMHEARELLDPELY